MAITVRLRDPGGNYVATLVDPGNVLNRILPLPEDSSFSVLNNVDPYATTDFKSADMPDLIEELERLSQGRLKPDDRAFLAQLKDFAERCMQDPTLRLRFVGD